MPPPDSSPQPLDYDKMILLDAEDLAEQGIAEAYEELLSQLRKYIQNPASLEEVLDTDVPTYLVRCNGKEHLIYSGSQPSTEDESWGRATYFLFLIINEQFLATNVRFYAINGGNDLAGIFLTQEQAQSAQAALPRKLDWPYIPALESPWYGQFH